VIAARISLCRREASSARPVRPDFVVTPEAEMSTSAFLGSRSTLRRMRSMSRTTAALE
jgi:hypothetical protein